MEFTILFIQRRIEAVQTFSPRQCVHQRLEWVRSQDPRVAAAEVLRATRERAARKAKRYKLIFWKVWTTSVFYKCLGWHVAPPIASDTNAQHV